MYSYLLYGLKFLSDIPLFNIPQSFSTDFSSDIIIKSDHFHNEIIPKKPGINIKTDYAVVRFLYGIIKINSGKEILYAIEDGYSAEQVTPYIMGWGMSFILSQRGYSAFHCSALTINNNCFFVSGVSGAGKSTTALELIKHGCKYLCDDIAIVDSYDNMLVPPAFPIQKVCPDVSLNLEQNSLYSITGDRRKYSYLNVRDFCDTPTKLTFFFQIILSDGDSIEITEVTGIQKYLKVMENLFLMVQYSYFSIPEEEKFRCLKIAGNIRFFTISRPKSKNTLDEITNTILKILTD